MIDMDIPRPPAIAKIDREGGHPHKLRSGFACIDVHHVSQAPGEKTEAWVS